MRNRILLVIGILAFSLTYSLKAEAQDEWKKIDENTKKYGLTDEDSVECRTNISLYGSSYKLWKQDKSNTSYLHDAMKYWYPVIANCPTASKNAYIRGAVMMNALIKENKKKKNFERVNGLTDTLLMLYDRRIEAFGEEGKVLGLKALDYFSLRKDSMTAIYAIASKSVELEKNKTTYNVLNVYFRSSILMVQNKKMETLDLIENFVKSVNIADYNIANNAKNAQIFKIVKAKIISQFDPYSDCTVLVEALQPKFDAGKEDISVLKSITKLLNDLECTNNQLFFNATSNLHSLEPTAVSAKLMGKMYKDKGTYREAVKYFEEALKIFPETETEDIYDCYLSMAFCNTEIGSYSTARSNANTAAKMKPESAKPLIILANVYASGTKACKGDPIESAAGYWVAVDVLNKAKTIEPENEKIMAACNSQIASYKSRFPSITVVFQHSRKEGETYNVGCWINKTTTIRVRK